jgi:hypothetical protein
MKRIRGLSNENYRERKEAITRALREQFGDCLKEGVKPEEQRLLDRLS